MPLYNIACNRGGDMIQNKLKAAMTQAISQIAQDAKTEVRKQKLVETGRLRRSIDSRCRLRFPTREDRRWAHADSIVLSLIYIGPSGETV